MNKKFFAFTAVLLLCLSAYAQTDGIQRVKGGFGKTDFAATTTATVYTVQQHALPSIIVNGDFATNTTWETGGTWTIGGGAATNVAIAAGTSSLTNDLTVADPRLRYDVIYTLATVTNGASVVASLGKQSWPANTAAGTYTNTFDIRESTELIFTATTTNANVLTLDNVTVRPIAQDAYLYRATFSNDGTGTVAVAFNTTTAKFAEYSATTAIVLEKDESFDFVGDNEQMYWLKGFVYESQSGTATLGLQGM